MGRRVFVAMMAAMILGPAEAGRHVLRPVGAGRHILGLVGAGHHVAYAQEGHPLTGTWAGEWDVSGKRTRVTVVMSWDGKMVSGIINPGPDAIPLSRVSVDWSSWTVRIEAKGVTAEGKLEDIGSARRRIVGTWTQGGAKGSLRLQRS